MLERGVVVAEPGADLSCPRLRRVSAERLEPCLEPGVLVDKGIALRRVGDVGELAGQDLEAMTHFGHRRRCAEDLGDDRPPAKRIRRLRQVPQTGAASEADRAAVGLLDAGDDLEQRRLTRPVRSDERQAVAGADTEVGAAEKLPRAERFAQSDDRDQGAAYRLTHSYIAMPDATPALIDRVEPNWGIDSTRSHAARASFDNPGPSWPNRNTQARAIAASSIETAPGRLSTPSTGRAA